MQYRWRRMGPFWLYVNRLIRSCFACPTGAICNSASNTVTDCAAGKYFDGAACMSCDQGYYCPSAEIGRIECPDGTYQPSTGQTTCIICPSGKSCETKIAATTCSPGFYLNENAKCINCVAGLACLATTTQKACNVWQYIDANGACAECEAGNYCDGNIKTACSSGYTNPTTKQTQCILCPVGFECTATTINLCTAGNVKLATGAGTCTPCSIGKYCPDPYNELTCPDGTYSDVTGLSECIKCPINTDCSIKTSIPDCDPGTYNYGDGACKTCPTGYYCSGTVTRMCQDGFYCAGSIETSCEVGYYCSSGLKYSCKDGYYMNETGAVQCIICPPGYYCPTTSKSATPTLCPLTGVYSAYSKEGSTVIGDCKYCADNTYCQGPAALSLYSCQTGTYTLVNVDGTTVCVPCPAGSKCDGTETVIACSTGQYAEVGESVCHDCPVGKYCPSMVLPLELTCDYGYYQPNGINQNICIVCPQNNECEDRINANLCTTYNGHQTYYSIEGTSFCKLCPGGFGCDSIPIVQCTAGFYSREGDSVCNSCPTGHYCPSGTADPIPCPPGTYAAVIERSVCTNVDNGKFVDFIGAVTQNPCPPGYECITTFSPPKLCSIGYYSDGNAISCTKCPEGYYCDAGATTAKLPFYLCPIGYYCTYNSGITPLKIPCPAGKLGILRGQNSEIDACGPCPAGYYCPTGTIIPLRCKRGYYCLANTEDANQYPCPARYYSPNYGIETEAECKVFNCVDGQYCPAATPVPIDCPPSYACAAASPDPISSTTCPIGTYSSSKILTDLAGCLACPSGSYCPAGSVFPTPCPPGTYHDGLTVPTELGAESECKKCPAGYACPRYGNRAIDYVMCLPGYYCPEGTTHPYDNPCPEGKYSDTYKNIDDSFCLACPAGYYCSLGTNSFSNPKKICPPGFICAGGNTPSNMTKCLAGKYSFRYGLTANSQCYDCPAGYMCEAGGLDYSTLCMAGYYCPPGTYNATKIPCPAGTYSTATGMKSVTECTLCEAGYYCALGSTTMEKCPITTFNPYMGKDGVEDCLGCPAGYYCNAEALIVPVPCGIGKYSDINAASCLTCIKGSFCRSKTTTAADMASSTFYCDKGYLCENGAVGEYPIESLYCPTGFYCPGGDYRYHGVSCSAGKYLPFYGGTDSTNCTNCPAGYYCEGIFGLGSTTSGQCQEGYYCASGSSDPRSVPCPEGTFRSLKGGKDLDDCGPCPAGYYCPEGTKTPYECPLGYYCDAKASFPTPCPQGTFGNQVNLRGLDECTTCYAGRYCSKSALTAPDGECDPGYYCTVGSFYPNTKPCEAGGICPKASKVTMPCDPGYFGGSTTGKILNPECTQCTQGYYCIGEVSTTPTGGCTAGYYCTTGSSSTTQDFATPGHFTLANQYLMTECGLGKYQASKAQDRCDTCPAGYMCDTTTNIGTFTPCPVGYYCPSGSHSSNKLPCSAGTYNPLTLGRDISACIPCPPGYKCPFAAMSTPDDCPAGSYCPESTSTTPTSCPVNSYCPLKSALYIPCPPGTHTNGGTAKSLLSHCLSCTANYYCSGGATRQFCDKGYYCLAGSKNPRPLNHTCNAGYSCAGNSAKAACLAGYWQPSNGMWYCLKCLKGYVCSSTGTTSIQESMLCSKGQYCIEGSPNGANCADGTYNNVRGAYSTDFCIPCPAGKLCPTGTGDITSLTDCPATQYCPTGSYAATQQPCSIQYYCPIGSGEPIKCLPGKYCDNAGVDSGSCTAGYYCNFSSTANQNICPAGYYCDGGVGEPIPCAEGTYKIATLGSTSAACSTCTAGSYCKGLAMSTSPTGCPIGYYCPSGTPALRYATYICPIGNKCPASQSAAQACTSGFYQDVIGQNTCIACPQGYYCSLTAKTYCKNRNSGLNIYCPPESPTYSTCGVGLINYVDGSYSSDDCVSCPAGSYCPNNVALAKVIFCPEGKYCPAGSAAPIDCQTGYYCPIGTPIQIPCPPGKYCSGANLTPTSIFNTYCNAGYYCKSECTSNTQSDGVKGMVCPAGYYCPQGTKEPISCPIGTYRSATGGLQLSDCIACPAGKVCDTRAITTPGVDCPAGFYCPAGTSANETNNCPNGAKCPSNSVNYTICPDGTYQPLPQQTDCLPCVAGFYCSNNNDLTTAMSPTICPKGNYCPQSSLTPTKCPIGTFSIKEGIIFITDCEKCSAGHFCDTLGMEEVPDTNKCAAGYYCKSGATISTPNDGTTNNKCPEGHYCEVGTSVPTECPPGTYTDDNEIGIDSVANCRSCRANYYCPQRGGTSSSYGGFSVSFRCRAGYVCLSGASTESPIELPNGRLCATGKYCDMSINIVESNCLIGTYNPNEGQATCMPCPVGRLCNTAGLSAPNVCPLGHYCPVGSSAAVSCPAGTYSNILNREKADDCLPCDPGMYCIGGLSTVSGSCNAGYVCTRGSSSSTPNSNVYDPNDVTKLNGKCPTGHYCLSGSKSPIPCPEGKYQDEVGKDTCKLCLSGYYCDELGLSTPYKKCKAGHICIGATNMYMPLDITTEFGRLCKAGFYCPEGSSIDVPCQDGTYEPREGQSECQTCPLGYYCQEDPLGTKVPKLCTAGHYCPVGTTAPVICPDGTYSNTEGLQRSDQCYPCTSGKYCQGGAIIADCAAGFFCDAWAKESEQVGMECPAGSYCPSGCKIPVICPLGKVRAAVGGKVESDCEDCPEGNYCLLGNPLPFDCPKGHYCPIKSFEPTPCQIGLYNPISGEKDVSSCIPCPAGSYCDEKGIADSNQFLCRPGLYCLGRDTLPINCPNGTYRESSGAASKTDCYSCPGGTYCLEGTIVPNVCNEGTYCKIGSSKMTKCPGGFYCPIKSTTPISCPAAYYCPEGSYKITKCQNGYYCPLESSAQIPCPAGTSGSGNQNNIDVQSGCISCGPGFYSELENGKKTECYECEPGYVCLRGCSTRFPVNKIKDFGYVCPPGYYCPRGSYEPTPCPKGMFSSYEMASNWTQCFYCGLNTYNNLVGQRGCIPCGPTSYTENVGEFTCSCKGKHRTYQNSDGSCPCERGALPVDLSEANDGLSECKLIVYDRCGAGEVRAQNGSCVSPITANDCTTCCPEGGKFSVNLGICLCDKVPTVEEVCDSDCRTQMPEVSVSINGSFTYVDPVTKKSTLIDLSKSDNLLGEVKCQKEKACKLASVIIDSTGKLLGTYDTAPFIKKKASLRRRLVESGTISNPSYCLYEGDSMLFDISPPTHYPVYLKDSLLSTIKDYSEFTQLETRIKAGETILAFAFTFQTAGTYAIGDAADTTQQMIVVALPESEKCPNDDQYIQPITTDSLLRLGIYQTEDIVVSQNWVVIISIYVAVVGLCLLIIYIFGYISRKGWKFDLTKFEFNRNLNKGGGDGNRLKGLNGLDDNENGIDEYIDPDLFKEIYNQLRRQRKDTQNAFDKLAKEGEDMIKNAKQSIEDLSLLMRQKVKNIAMTYGKNIKKIFKNPDDKKKEANEVIEVPIEEPMEELEKCRAQVEEILVMDNRNNPNICEENFEELLKKQSPLVNDMEKYESRMIKEYQRELDDNWKMPDKDKKDLLKQAKEQYSLLKKKMLLEQQNQKESIIEKMRERERKKEFLQKKLEEERNKQLNIIKEEDNKLKQIEERLKEEQTKTMGNFEEEKDKLTVELKKKHETEKNKIKDTYTNKIAQAGANQSTVGNLITQYKKILAKLQENAEKDDKHLNDILMQKLSQRNKAIAALQQSAEAERANVLKLKEEKAKDQQKIVSTIEAQVSNQVTQEHIRVELNNLKPNVDNEALKKEYEETLNQLSKKEEDELNSERKKEKLIDNDQYEEVKKLAAQADEKNHTLAKEMEDKKAEYLRRIANTDSQKERDALLSKSKQEEEAIKNRIKNESNKMLLLTKERVAERKAAKREKENSIKTAYEQQREALEKQHAEELYQASISKAKELLNQGVKAIKEKFKDYEQPQALDSLLNNVHNQELMALLCKQMQEKEARLRRMIGKFITEKSIKMVKTKMDFDDLYKNLMKQKTEQQNPLSQEEYDAKIMEIKVKENDKLDDLEIELAKAQGEEEENIVNEIESVHNEQLLKLKEDQSKERAFIIAETYPDKFVQAYYCGDDEFNKKELEEYKNILESKLKEKTKEISKKKAKLKEITEANEVKLLLIEDAVSKKMDAYKAKEREKEEKRKREFDLQNKDREEQLHKKYNEDDTKAKLLEEHARALTAYQRITEEERRRQQEMMEELLQERLKMREKLKKEKEEQIALFKRGEAEWKQQLLSKKIIGPVYAESPVEESKFLADNNLIDLHHKYDKKKMLIEKPKMASIDIEKKAVMTLVGGFESNLEKLYSERTKAASINLLEKFDFDILLNKITMLEQNVDEFSQNKFDNLKDGFRKMNKTLDDLKNNTAGED